MNNGEIVKRALEYAGKTQREIADEMEKLPNVFTRALSTDALKTSDIQKIANIIGAEYVSYLVFPDGKKISIDDIVLPPKEGIEKLRFDMKKKNISQKKIATLLGVSNKTISRKIINDKFTPEELKKINKYLDSL